MTDYHITDPDFETRVRDSYVRQGFIRLLGAELVRIEAGQAEIVLPFSEQLTQQDGFLHAGVVTTLVDTACGYAAYTLMPKGSRVLSAEFKINFLSPAQGERFRAVGNVIKSGSTLSVCEGRLYALDRSEEKLVAVMQATMICIRDS